MKILQIIDHLGFGGAQNAIVDVVTSWPAPADEIDVLGIGRNTTMLDAFRHAAGDRVRVLGAGKWNIAAVRQVAALAARNRYDVIHAHCAKAVCTALWSQPRMHGTIVVHLQCDPDRDSKIQRLAIRRWRRRAGAFIAASQSVADMSASWYRLPAGAIHVIPNAVDFERLAPRESLGDVRRRLDLPGDAFLFGFVGRLHPQKGVTHLLKAMEILKHHTPRVAVVLVGDGPLRRSLEAEARRRDVAGQVRFVGFQSDVGAWLEAIDAGVLPSLYEGLPLSVVEMMGFRKPVVATRVSGTPEAVDDGETGLLVTPANPQELADAMLRLAESEELRNRLADRAYEHARGRFSAERFGPRVRAVYEHVLGQAGALAEAEGGNCTRHGTRCD